MSQEERLAGRMVDDLKTFAKWAFTSILDAVFIVFWYGLQEIVSRFVDSSSLSGLDRVQLITVQILFAVTTLAPIFFYVLLDLAKMYYQALGRLRELSGAEIE